MGLNMISVANFTVYNIMERGFSKGFHGILINHNQPMSWGFMAEF